MTMEDQKKGRLLPFILLVVGVLALGLGYMLATAAKKEAPAPYAPPPAATAAATTPPSSSAPDSSAAETQAPPATAQDVLDRAAARTIADRAARAEVPALTTAGTSSAATPVPVMEAEGRFLGSKNAPVKMIEFSSLTCSHCAHFHNEILDEFRVKYVDTNLVQIEFRAFPLNKPALDATKILGCLPENQYFPFMSMLFQTQDHWAFTSDYMTPLRQNAKLAGLSDAQIDACVNNAAADKKIVEEMQNDGKVYKVEATPTFVISSVTKNGADSISGAVPLAEFSKVIDPLLPTQKVIPKTKGNIQE